MADATTTNGGGGGEFGDAPLAHARALASHRGFVRALARGLVSRDDFEDVAQEALLAGVVRRPERAQALRGWLATTVRHLAGKLHRGARRRAEREEFAAQAEALPSAYELVERIELEQSVVRAVLALKEPQRTAVLLRFYEGHSTAAIAERLRLPADTVRARLRRGLAELRVQLDAKFGRREDWVAALLPVAGIPPGVLGPGLVTGSAAAGATGAAVMGAKAITILTTACATALLAWWVLPDRFTSRLFGPALSTAATKSGDHGAARAGNPTAVTPAPASANALAATREAEANGSDGAAAAGANAAQNLPPPGTIHFEVVDAHTQKPLDHVKVHFLHEKRFAECEADASVNVKLTSGKWEANVASAGYEPAQLNGLEVKVGETLNLGKVALDRGNAVVEGRVVANHLAADKPVVIELFGDGRAPCDACLARRARACANANGEEEQNVEIGGDCGFRDDRNLLTLTGGRDFRFGNLAAGVYWLRACDPDQRIVDAVRLEVGRGGSIWKELDVGAPTVARFELRHESGGLFSGAWSAIHQARVAAIRYSIRRNGQEVASVEHTPAVEETLASVGPPIAIPGREPQLANAQDAGQQLIVRWFATVSSQKPNLNLQTGWVNRIGAQVIFNDLVANSEEERLDRERQEGDRLGFDFGAPGCDGVALKVNAIRPDLHEIAPLPRSELSVVVQCGEFHSDELPLDLQNDQFQPLVVTMHLRQEIADRMAEIRKGPPASCVACHGEPLPTSNHVVYGNESEISVDYSGSVPIVGLPRFNVDSINSGIEISFDGLKASPGESEQKPADGGH